MRRKRFRCGVSVSIVTLLAAVQIRVLGHRAHYCPGCLVLRTLVLKHTSVSAADMQWLIEFV